MKKLLFTLFSLASFSSFAQVDGRVFTITSAAYTPLTTPTAITTPGWDDFSAQVPLGFSFKLFGTTTSTIYFDSTGLGADMSIAPTGTTHGLLFLTDFYDKGNSTVSYKTDVVNSKKITKIQWKNVGFFDDTSANSIDSANFQAWFYETTGDFELHWGSSYIKTTEVFLLQRALFGFAKNYSITQQSFDSAYYVSSTSPATLKGTDYFTLLSSALMNTPVGFSTTYPASGTVFKFSNPTAGVNSVKLNSYTEVYPTLVSSTTSVMLTKDVADATIRLIDMSGKIALSQKAVTGRNNVDMAALPSGNYVLNISTAEESVFYKISKQ